MFIQHFMKFRFKIFMILKGESEAHSSIHSLSVVKMLIWKFSSVPAIHFLYVF